MDGAIFATAKAGDVIYLRCDIDEEAATTASETWYQLTVSYGDWSAKIVEAYDMSRTRYWSHTLTADEVTTIQSKGIAFSGHFIKITDVAFGDAFSSSAIQYWDSSTSAWSTGSYVVSTDKDTWTSAPLNNDNLKDCHAGDRITVNFTTTATEAWDARLCLYYAVGDPWITLYDLPVGGGTTASMMIDRSIWEKVATGDIYIGGCNITITSIALEYTDLYYSLRSNSTDVDINQLPTYPINITLNKAFDWNATLCVPFDIASVTSTFGSTVKAYTYSQKGDDNKLIFSSSESIEAGVPYYMTFGEADKDLSSITLEGVTIKTTVNDKTAGGYSFKGNYTPSMDMEGKYGLSCKEIGSGNWVWAFYKGSTGTKLNAFCAYIETSGGGSSGAPSFSISFDGNTTGISSARAAEAEQGDVYNLMGVKVQNVTKGIFIKNGKKFVVK